MTAKKQANPIDIFVGSRVRLRRLVMGLSQEKLGEQLGVTFQQIQKYEKGSNRIGASRLQSISKVLQVPVSFFFEGAPGGMIGPDDAAGGFFEPSPDYMVDFLSTPDGLQLNRAFANIPDPKIRRRIVELVQSLADEQEKSS